MRLFLPKLLAEKLDGGIGVSVRASELGKICANVAILKKSKAFYYSFCLHWNSRKGFVIGELKIEINAEGGTLLYDRLGLN